MAMWEYPTHTFVALYATLTLFGLASWCIGIPTGNSFVVVCASSLLLLAYILYHEESPSQCIDRITTATLFAARAHATQRRKNIKAEPYINHPLSVANLLTRLGNVTDADVIIAAILHDTVEDTPVKLGDIEFEFGARVRSIVAEVSDDKALPKEKRKQLQVEHAPHKSPQAKLVKLADKLDNLGSMLSEPPATWDEARIRGYFVWAHAVVAGLRGTNAALEHALDRVFSSTFRYAGRDVPALPHADDMGRVLERYYAAMSVASD